MYITYICNICSNMQLRQNKTWTLFALFVYEIYRYKMNA
jgi:hypothetical protein